MDEIEDSTESLHEKIHEEAHEAQHDPKSKWIVFVALFTAIVAVLAAITGMLSGDNENEALISQIKASDQWAYYQAKSIKAEITSSTLKIMNAAKEDADAKANIERYKAEQEEIKQKAEEFSVETEVRLTKHVKLARAVTLFQITIAVSAISILTRRKFFWYIGIVFALSAVFFLMQGIT